MGSEEEWQIKQLLDVGHKMSAVLFDIIADQDGVVRPRLERKADAVIEMWEDVSAVVEKWL